MCGSIHKENRGCPNGCGLKSWPVGIPGASGHCPNCVPLARTHYRVTFRTAAAHAKSALWIETNYVVIFYVRH